MIQRQLYRFMEGNFVHFLVRFSLKVVTLIFRYFFKF